jgi:hypothetical protein
VIPLFAWFKAKLLSAMDTGPDGYVAIVVFELVGFGSVRHPVNCVSDASAVPAA